ncbi:MAG: hypothetical protein JW810_02245 [Sedimentisphaerales bacterium]|nr:hypothetical protein [Sedimentisphaerales bacterium]
MNQPPPQPLFRVPGQSGQTAFWPAVRRMEQAIHRNQRLFAGTECRILGGSLRFWRSRLRRWLRVELDRYARSLSLPPPSPPPEGPQELLIATGHQPGFHHGGIFVKYLLLDVLTRGRQALAVNLVADTDLPRDTALRFAWQTCDGWQAVRLETPGLRMDCPMEQQPPIDAEAWRRFAASLRRQEGPGQLTDALRHLADLLDGIIPQVDRPADLFVVLNHRLAEPLGVRWWDLPVSRLAESEAFGAFALDLLLRSSAVHDGYNQVLAGYRRRHRIRSARQPLADLGEARQDIIYREMPFWILRDRQGRRPLFVHDDNEQLILFDGRRELTRLPRRELTEPAGREDAAGPEGAVGLVELLRRRLADSGVVLRPRAVTLTAFARLFLADYFVHGIGAARYDQVTDDVIRRVYRLEPPAFAVATATVHLPYAPPTDPVQFRHAWDQARRHRRDLYYNPHRHITEPAGDPPEPRRSNIWRELLDRRAEWIRRSELLRRQGGRRQLRREAFEALHAVRDEMAAEIPQLIRRSERNIEIARDRCRMAAIAGDREYFFGLIPPDAWRRILERIARSAESDNPA